MSEGSYQHLIGYNYRQVPWHGNGLPLEDNVSVYEAGRIAGIYAPIYQAVSSGYTLPDGTVIPMDQIDPETHDKSFAIMRAPWKADPQWAVLGSSSNRYSIIQNDTLAQILEPLTQFGRVSTVGLLGKGERVFFTFEGDELMARIGPKKEQFRVFLIVKNTHLPGAGIQIQLSFVRVVCINTFEASNADAKSTGLDMSIAHVGDLETVMKFVVNTLTSIPKRTETTMTALEQMADMPVKNDQEVKSYLLEVLHPPKMPKLLDAITVHTGGEVLIPELQMVADAMQTTAQGMTEEWRVKDARYSALRDLAFSTYKTSETVLRGTRYGMFNALTEALDHGVRTSSNMHQTKSTKQSAWAGERRDWKIKGFDVALHPEAYSNN